MPAESITPGKIKRMISSSNEARQFAKKVDKLESSWSAGSGPSLRIRICGQILSQVFLSVDETTL